MESLSSSKNILILLSPSLHKNNLYLVTALGTLLVRSGKTVSILLENKEKVGSNGNALEKIVIDRKILNLNLIDKILPKKTIITVNKGNSKIKNVLWKEEAESLLFQIESVEGNFEIKDVDFKTSGTEADTIIFVGCKEINDLSSLYSTNPTLFTNAYSINLDNGNGNLRFAKSNYVMEGETFTKVFMNFLNDSGLIISSQESTLFLHTLLLETKVFTSRLEKSEGIFETALELIKLGANYSEALNNYNSLTQNAVNQRVDTVKIPEIRIPKPFVPNQFTPVNTSSGNKQPNINTPNVNDKSLDKIFPKVPLKDEPQAIKVSQTESKTPLFTPYSAPSFNTKPVYKQYQGFVPSPQNPTAGNK